MASPPGAPVEHDEHGVAVIIRPVRLAPWAAGASPTTTGPGRRESAKAGCGPVASRPSRDGGRRRDWSTVRAPRDEEVRRRSDGRDSDRRSPAQLTAPRPNDSGGRSVGWRSLMARAPSPLPHAATLVLLVRHGQTPTTGTTLPGRAPGLHLADDGPGPGRGRGRPHRRR